MARRRSATPSPLALVLFVGAFTLFNAAITWFVLVMPALKWKAAQGWTETPCVIVESDIVSTKASKGGRSGSALQLVYSYQFDGRDYRGAKYSIMPGFITGALGMKPVIAKNPVGTKTVCYVNPSDHAEAIFTRGLTPFMLFALIPLLFTLLGLLWFVGFTRQQMKR